MLGLSQWQVVKPRTELADKLKGIQENHRDVLKGIHGDHRRGGQTGHRAVLSDPDLCLTRLLHVHQAVYSLRLPSSEIPQRKQLPPSPSALSHLTFGQSAGDGQAIQHHIEDRGKQLFQKGVLCSEVGWGGRGAWVPGRIDTK